MSATIDRATPEDWADFWEASEDCTAGTVPERPDPAAGEDTPPAPQARRSPHTHSGPEWTTSYHEGTRA